MRLFGATEADVIKLAAVYVQHYIEREGLTNGMPLAPGA